MEGQSSVNSRAEYATDNRTTSERYRDGRPIYAPIVKLDIIRLCESLVSGSNPDWGTSFMAL